jgi:DNA-3-methyladenine glycosylase II
MSSKFLFHCKVIFLIFFLLTSKYSGAQEVVTISDQIDEEPIVKKHIADWFDIGLDLSPFYTLLAKDPRLAFMANAYHGLRLVGIPDMFEAICWAITGQQINLTFAYKLKRRLVERYGRRLDFGGHAYFLFPDAAIFAEASI